MDADLRASGIQANYRLKTEKGKLTGLSEYLSGHCLIEDAMYQTDIPGAVIIPSGHEAPNPLQLLETAEMKMLMQLLSEQYDVILLDTPPVGMLADAVSLAKYCDGALLVVSYRHGKQSDIASAVDSLKQTGCRVLGAVLNEVRFKNLSNRHHYYNSKRYTSYYRGSYGRKK